MSEVSHRVEPLNAVPRAVIRVPGSKSYTNRALPIAALAQGQSELTGALFSDDTRYMAAALRLLGVSVEAEEATHRFEVRGTGGRLAPTSSELYVGNAGTAARFLSAILASGTSPYRIDGVARMRERPMRDLLDALISFGVRITEHGKPGCFPVTIDGSARSSADLAVTLPGTASSQFISALLIAAPCLGQSLTVHVEGELVSKPYLDMTQAVMESFGVQLDNRGYSEFRVSPGQAYLGRDYAVEPDASAASYFFAIAAITGGEITITGLGTGSRQGDLKFVDVLERMGARVERSADSTTVHGPAELRGVEVDLANLSDTAQTLAVVAPFASSPTRITGIGFIRNKETDRVGNVVRELNKRGIDAIEEPDGMLIRPGVPQPGRVSTYDDHRMAMSFALLGLKTDGIEIADPGCTSKTFPSYWKVLDSLRVG